MFYLSFILMCEESNWIKLNIFLWNLVENEMNHKYVNEFGVNILSWSCCFIQMVPLKVAE